MTAAQKKIAIRAVLAVAAIIAAYVLLMPHPVADNAEPPDQYGCRRPSSEVFSKLGLDVSVASASYSKLVLGKIDVKTDPGIVDLVGRASKEATVRDYLRCLAISRDKFNTEQAAYTDRFNAFMATTPTPDQFIQWQKDNPFPRVAVITKSTVVACSNLNVSAEWDGTSAPERTQSCSYTAPANCKILSSKTDTHSDNNGSASSSVAPDSRTLTATVTARPHGSLIDRKRGWIEVSVSADLSCET